MVLKPLCAHAECRAFTKTGPGLRGMLLIMKFTAIFLLAFCLVASAHTDAQRITLTEKNITLEKALKEIKRQSGLPVLYTKSMLQKTTRINVSLKDVPLAQAMEEILKDQALDYTIINETIVLKEKAKIEIPDAEVSINKVISIDVSGTVTDTEGNPLVGATVAVKGTTNATKTDASGVYTLKGIDENATLEVSYAEHESLIIQVKGRSSVMVSLKKNVSPLDEVQVIAYGARSKRFETGNVTTVKGEDIAKQPVNNVLLAIADRVPGLFITQATGLPGSGVKVAIEGQNSLRSGTEPFYVVDGVPYTSMLLSNYGAILGNSGQNAGFMASGNPLSFLNPADIESISILKDADATAIYGSRAANGAILITTKKGKSGQTKLEVNMQTGWARIARKLDLLNTQQYLAMRREAKRNDNARISTTDYDLNGLWDTTSNTDWQSELIGNTAHYTDIQATVSGGNNNTQVLASVGYHRETTVFPGDLSDQKASLHFSMNNVSNNQKFRVQFTGSYLVDNNRLISRDLTQDAITLAPNAPRLYNVDGQLNWMPNAAGRSTWTNPLAYLNNRYKNKTNNLVANGLISYNIIPGLDIRSSFGYTNLQSNEVATTSMLSYMPENRSSVGQRGARYSNSNLNTWIIEPQISYKAKYGKNRIEAFVGATVQQNFSNGLRISGVGYNSDVVLEDIRSASNITIEGNDNLIYKYNAVFGRLNYNLDGKYLINLTARRDGSSRFGSSNQFHNFGAMGVGWIFSNEKFVAKKLPFLNFGKITASYGTTGNDQIGDYTFMSLYFSSVADVPFQGVTGLTTYSLQNAFLQWEETNKFQTGLDLGFFNERLVFAAHYYNNISKNQLLYFTLPIQTGFNGVSKNFPATVQNSGWEITLGTSNIKNTDFSWKTNLNVTLPKNKLLAFPGIESSGYASTLLVGKPVSLIYCFRFAGVDPSTGTYRFLDSKGNITSNPNFSTDRTAIIDLSPVFYGGVQNSLRYKNFDFDFSFQFAKRKGPNYAFGNRNGGIANYNSPLSVTARWTKPGDISPIQRYNSSQSLSTSVFYAVNSDAGYDDAAFVRLKNISFSWKMPESWINKRGLKNARLYLQGQNLLTITNYIGIDPETLSSTTLPPLKVLTLGLQVGL